MGGLVSGIMGLVNTGANLVKTVKQDQLDSYKKEYAGKYSNFVDKNIPYNIDRVTRLKTLPPEHPYSEQSISAQLELNQLPPGYTTADLIRLGYYPEVLNMNIRKKEKIDGLINDMNNLLKQVLDNFHAQGLTDYDDLINSVINEADQSNYINRFNNLLKQAQTAISEQELDNSIAEQKATREQALETASMRLLAAEDMANVNYLNNVKVFAQ